MQKLLLVGLGLCAFGALWKAEEEEDGMAIALHSGQQAARAWLTDHDAAAYQQTLTQTLTPQMRLAGLLHGAGTNALTQNAAVHFLRWFPGLLRHAASRTRLPNAARDVLRTVRS